MERRLAHKVVKIEDRENSALSLKLWLLLGLRTMLIGDRKTAILNILIYFRALPHVHLGPLFEEYWSDSLECHNYFYVKRGFNFERKCLQ